MFMCDKYKPSEPIEMTFHADIMDRLCGMSSDNSIPHIILYGPDGAGKRTIARILLEHIFDKSVNHTTDTTYNVSGCGNSVSEVNIKRSSYHIVINPNNNNFDRYLIQNVVKEYAKRIPFDVFQTSKPFKVVLINDIDNLSYYAQMSLRRTMEKYSRTCRFLLICNAISKLIEPLRSRCICVRIPAPTDAEMINTIMSICHHESYDIKLETLTRILDMANRNIKHAIWLLEFAMRNIPLENSHSSSIDNIINIMLFADLSHIDKIRSLMYGVLLTNVSGSDLIQELLLKLCKKLFPLKERLGIRVDEIIYHIIECASKCEHNVVIGRREIIHLECFVVSTMRVLSEYNVHVMLE